MFRFGYGGLRVSGSDGGVLSITVSGGGFSQRGGQTAGDFSRRQRGYIFQVVTQKTREVGPMLIQWWDSVIDNGPTLTQHHINVSCLLGYCYISKHILLRTSL